MNKFPGFGIFLAVLVAFWAVGSVFGYLGIGRLSYGRMFVIIGGFCFAVAEPILGILYYQGVFTLIDSFYISWGFLSVGVYGLSYGQQRMLKEQRIELKNSKNKNKTNA